LTRIKHVFRQDAECLQYAALGDTAVRILAIHHIIESQSLDALIVPPSKPDFVALWQAVFGPERIFLNPAKIPESHWRARISHPTSLDWMFGSAGWTVFESVLWENAFFETRDLVITPPIVFRADHRSRAVMIYPAEGTDGNRVYTAEWWVDACTRITERGWRINLLGRLDHPSIRKISAAVAFDQVFPPTISGMRACVGASSRAIGGSTGPTWALLMSDIPQVVLESRRAPHGYWFFDRCQQVLSKRLHIVSTLESAIPAMT
jgi:hypothetical protein